MVKFMKEQIKALSQIEVKANEMFDDDLSKGLHEECDRFHVVRCYTVGILRAVIKDGAIYGV